MSEDVEAKLAALEARLNAVQAEVGGAPAPPPGPAPAQPPDPLDQFGVELRRLAAELVAAYDRVLAHERRRPGAQHRLVLEAQADLAALAALERALRESPGVASVELRAYAAGHASLVVDVG